MASTTVDRPGGWSKFSLRARVSGDLCEGVVFGENLLVTVANAAQGVTKATRQFLKLWGLLKGDTAEGGRPFTGGLRGEVFACSGALPV